MGGTPAASRTEQSAHSRYGFTAWETVVIIALLIALTFLVMKLLVSGSIADQRRLTISRLEAAADGLTKYAIDNGGLFPTTEQGLGALLALPTSDPVPHNWCGPYLPEPESIEDAWCRRFHYVRPGGPANPPRSYDLWSLGADGAEGGAGPDADILSWDRATLLP